MGKKMIKTGLSCRVNAKLMLMKCFLSNEATRRLVIEKMKEMGTGGMSVPEECQELLMKEFGMRITSVTRLDDEGLEKVYDRLAPVSYTHLDVYKRQGTQRAVFRLCGLQSCVPSRDLENQRQ